MRVRVVLAEDAVAGIANTSNVPTQVFDDEGYVVKALSESAQKFHDEAGVVTAWCQDLDAAASRKCELRECEATPVRIALPILSLENIAPETRGFRQVPDRDRYVIQPCRNRQFSLQPNQWRMIGSRGTCVITSGAPCVMIEVSPSDMIKPAFWSLRIMWVKNTMFGSSTSGLSR